MNAMMRRRARTSHGGAIAACAAVIVAAATAYVTGCGARPGRSPGEPASADDAPPAAGAAGDGAANDRATSARAPAVDTAVATAGTPDVSPQSPAAGEARRNAYTPRWPSMKFDYGTKADYYVAVDDANATDDGPGSEAKPFKTLERACAVAKAGDVVAIKEGTYREALMPRNPGREGAPVTFQAYGSDVVDIKGSVEVDGFVREGTYWVKKPWSKTFWFSKTMEGVSQAPFKRSSRLEQIFVDERALDWVPSREHLKPGHFVWGDGEVVICPHEEIDDLNAHLVEATMLSQVLSVWQGDPRGPEEYLRRIAKEPGHPWSKKKAIKTNIDHIHVKGLRFRHATHVLNRSGCRFDGKNWLMENCYVEYMNAVGVVAGPGGVVRDCVIRYNGQGGFAARGPHTTFENLITMYNNRKLYRTGWGGAGNKICGAEDCHVKNVLSCFNFGSGIWFDIDNRDCVIEDCVVFGDRPINAGYFWEISYNAIFRNNVDFASRDERGTYYGASAVISCSQDVVFEDNVFVGGAGGLSVGGGRPKGDGKWISVNNLFRRNLVVEPSGFTISVRDNGQHNSADPAAKNRFVDNTFLVKHGAARVKFGHDWVDDPIAFAKVNPGNVHDNTLSRDLDACEEAQRRRLDVALKEVLNALVCATPKLDLKIARARVLGIWQVGSPGAEALGYFVEGDGKHYLLLDTYRASGGTFDIISAGAMNVALWDCPVLEGPRRVPLRSDGGRYSGRASSPFALVTGLSARTIALSSAVEAFTTCDGRRTNEIPLGDAFTATVVLSNPLDAAIEYKVFGDGLGGERIVKVGPGQTARIDAALTATEDMKTLNYLVYSKALPRIQKKLDVNVLRALVVPRTARSGVARFSPSLVEEGARIHVGEAHVLRDVYDVRAGFRWEDEKDLSAEVRLTYTDRALCATFAVTDPDHTVNNPPHAGDCIELFLDGRVEGFGALSYGKGVYQVFIPAPTSTDWGPCAWKSGHVKSGLRPYGKRTDCGYVMAIELPWTLFPELQPKPGTVVGFDVAVDDADGQPRRKAQLVWHGAGDNYKNASRFGRIRLGK